jgi:hypothetical protein
MTVSMLTEIFLCVLYAVENVIRLFACNQPDIPGTPPRKPTQPQELRPAHLLTFSIHERTCAAKRLAVYAPCLDAQPSKLNGNMLGHGGSAQRPDSAARGQGYPT